MRAMTFWTPKRLAERDRAAVPEDRLAQGGRQADTAKDAVEGEQPLRLEAIGEPTT